MPNTGVILTQKVSEHDIESLKMSEMILFMELQDILQNQKINPVFQPIVSLNDATIIGYEALSRGPKTSILARPDELFLAAAKFNLVWETEYLCRDKALEKAKDILSDKMIFINVDPKIINDPRFQKGHTKEIIAKLCANAGNVIFEITEKTAVEDYKNFCSILENYTSQGYKIAIDDTGSGYSGLNMLAQIRPHFIKMDMGLVRDIDKDGLKQAIMKALYDFSVSTNSKIIAEGIETEAELTTLINIGIPYGQGYFLQKPAEEFLEISTKSKQIIISKNKSKKRASFHTIPIGEIVQRDSYFTPQMLGSQALEYFKVNPSIQGIPIVENNKPVGLLMKNQFLISLATQYGVSVYMNRPVSILMDKNPLIMEYDTPFDLVSKSAVSRNDDNIYDNILIVKEGWYYGTVTIKRLLEEKTQLDLNYAKHVNPLTGLPGNIFIEEQLNGLISENGKYAVLYFDLDNFKAYNDVYGFENGDKLISFTAHIIQKYLEQIETTNTFLGHIGGDDFIAIVNDVNVVAVCENIIASFDNKVCGYYTEEDKRRGYIITKNRNGKEEKFPLVTLSIAVVTNRKRYFHSPATLGEAASNLKKKCKLIWKSCYYID